MRVCSGFGNDVEDAADQGVKVNLEGAGGDEALGQFLGEVMADAFLLLL